MKAWITKSLDRGIEEVEAILYGKGEKYILYSRPQEYRQILAFGKGRTWHLTFDSACLRMKAMRDREIALSKKRIINLQKKIEKLEKMEFNKGGNS